MRSGSRASSLRGRAVAARGWLRAMTCPGTPTTTEPGGTGLTTTALAPIRLSSPMVMGPRILAPDPMITRSPMVGWRLPLSVLVPPSVTP